VLPTATAAAPTATATAIPTATSVPTTAYSESFESGTGAWTDGDAGTQTSQSGNYAKDGTHSLQVSYQNTGTGNQYHHVQTTNLSTPPRAGQVMTAYVYVPAGNVTTSAFICVESNNNWYGDTFVSLKAGQWNRLTYTVLPGMSVTNAGIRFMVVTGTGAANPIYFDAISWS